MDRLQKQIIEMQEKWNVGITDMPSLLVKILDELKSIKGLLKELKTAEVEEGE